MAILKDKSSVLLEGDKGIFHNLATTQFVLLMSNNGCIKHY